MAITKEKKKEILAKINGILGDSESVVFVNFHGLGVSETTEIRRGLKEKGVGYYVAKKTLTQKALDEAGIEGSKPELEGELGIVYGKDLIDPAREVYSFQKKLEDRIAILGGIFEGKFMNKDEMTSVAQIPGMKTLQAQFVNLINSPVQGFVMALGRIAEKKG